MVVSAASDTRTVSIETEFVLTIGRQGSARAEGNPKKLWKNLASVSKREKVVSHPSDGLTAESFLNAFRDKVEGIRASTASEPPPSFDSPPCTSSFSRFRMIGESDLHRLVSAAANKPCKLDPVPTWLVKYADELSPFITFLFNASLTAGQFPSSQKCAMVTPILKKPTLDPNDLLNYCPISNLTFLSKLLERVVHEQLMSYISTNNLLPDEQLVYHKHRSTETAVLRVLSDAFAAADRGLVTLIGFLDLSAAFDTVDHRILLNRLNHSFGVEDVALGWMASYLEKRSQFVRFYGSVSSTAYVSASVPQGSVLGPVYFIAYTADDFRILHDAGFNVMGYADDLQLYNHSLAAEVTSLASRMSSCIADVGAWMASNYRRLNPTKTELILLGSPRQLVNITLRSVRIDEAEIPLSPLVWDLGVYLDSGLSLQDHTDKTVRLSFFHLRQLRLIRRSLPQDAMHSLVHALVHSRLDYCNSILANAPSGLLGQLQSVLRAAARLVLHLPACSQVSDLMHEKLHWLDINKRVTFKLCIIGYKCQHELSPGYLSSMCVPSCSIPGRASLRSSTVSTLLVPRVSTKSFGMRGFFHACPSIWNNIPPH